MKFAYYWVEANMCVVIDSKVVISNVFYAYLKRNKDNNILEYYQIDQYRKLLYKEISNVYRYVLFSDDDSECYDFHNHFFVKNTKGVLCLDKVDESFIEEVNSIYPKEIQKIIKDSREKIAF